ncbi:MAG TPA: LysR substrate-binding domain-containing protein, partial [Rhodospirillales bacterium]
LRPTPEGERLVAQARRVLEEAARLTAIAGPKADAPLARLRVGLESTLAAGCLDWLAPAVAATFPSTEAVFKEASETLLVAAIAARDIDAALVPMPGADARHGCEPLFDEPLVAILPAGHVLAAHQDIELRDLARHRPVLPPGALREIMIAACGMTEADIEAASEAASLETLRQMVAAGLGASLVPALAAPAVAGARRREDGGAIVVRSCAPPPKRRVALVWRREFPQADRLRRLADEIRRTVPRIVKPVARRAAG